MVLCRRREWARRVTRGTRGRRNLYYYTDQTWLGGSVFWPVTVSVAIKKSSIITSRYFR